MFKFAYATYEKYLTDIRSFLRGLSFNKKKYCFDYLKCLTDKYVKKKIKQDVIQHYISFYHLSNP